MASRESVRHARVEMGFASTITLRIGLSLFFMMLPQNPGSSDADSSLPVVRADSLLTLHYRMAGEHGDVVNTFGGAPATFSLGQGALAETLEQQLLGLPEGTHTTFTWPAGVVFGTPDPAMRQWVKRSELEQCSEPDTQYQIGEVVQFSVPEGESRFAGTIVDLDEQAVLLDFNHPLASQSVTFEVHILSVL